MLFLNLARPFLPPESCAEAAKTPNKSQDGAPSTGPMDSHVNGPQESVQKGEKARVGSQVGK